MLATTVETPRMLNGLNVDDVMQLINTVKENPAEGQTRWSVSSVWLGGTLNRATIRSFEMGGHEYMRPFTMEVDEPLQIGGTDTQPNPQEYLLAALNAQCPGEVQIDVPEDKENFADLLLRAGFSRGFETARMYRGPAPELDRSGIFGISTLELG